MIAEIPFNLPVSEESISEDDEDEDDDERYEALYDIEESIYDLNVSNSTTIDDIENCANSALTDKNLTVTISDFELEPATETKIGYINGNIELTDAVNNLTVDGYYYNEIYTTSAAALRDLVNTYIDSLVASNSTNEATILEGVKNAINDEKVRVNIDDFYLRKAISGDTGYCYFGVELRDSYDNELYIDYLSEDFTSTSEGSTSNNSGSSSSSTTSSSAGSTSTTTIGTTSATDSAVPGVSASQLLSGAVTKEVAKVIEVQVVSNLTKALGEGTVSGQAKVVSTAANTIVDGYKLDSSGAWIG